MMYNWSARVSSIVLLYTSLCNHLKPFDSGPCSRHYRQLMISPCIKLSVFVLTSVTLYFARSYNASAIVLGTVHVVALP